MQRHLQSERQNRLGERVFHIEAGHDYMSYVDEMPIKARGAGGWHRAKSKAHLSEGELGLEAGHNLIKAAHAIMVCVEFVKRPSHAVQPVVPVVLQSGPVYLAGCKLPLCHMPCVAHVNLVQQSLCLAPVQFVSCIADVAPVKFSALGSIPSR